MKTHPKKKNNKRHFAFKRHRGNITIRSQSDTARGSRSVRKQPKRQKLGHWVVKVSSKRLLNHLNKGKKSPGDPDISLDRPLLGMTQPQSPQNPRKVDILTPKMGEFQWEEYFGDSNVHDAGYSAIEPDASILFVAAVLDHPNLFNVALLAGFGFYGSSF